MADRGWGAEHDTNTPNYHIRSLFCCRTISNFSGRENMQYHIEISVLRAFTGTYSATPGEIEGRFRLQIRTRSCNRKSCSKFIQATPLYGETNLTLIGVTFPSCKPLVFVLEFRVGLSVMMRLGRNSGVRPPNFRHCTVGYVNLRGITYRRDLGSPLIHTHHIFSARHI